MSSGPNAAVLRIDHGDQAEQLLLAQDRHGQHRPRRVRRARLDAPSPPRPPGRARRATTIGRSVRDPRAVPIRACSVASPRSGSYSSSRPPRDSGRLHGRVQHGADQRLQVVGRGQRLAVAVERLLEPPPLAGQLRHPDRQLARHRVQGGAQLDQLVAALGHRLAAGADDRLGAAGQVGQRLRDAVGGAAGRARSGRGRAGPGRAAGAGASARCGRPAPTADRWRGSRWATLLRPLDPGALHPHLRPADVASSSACRRPAPAPVPVPCRRSSR